MTGSLADLLAAVLAFVGAHLILSSRPVRDPLVARIGERAFTGAYSACIALLFAWMIVAYRVAPDVEIWSAPIGIKHISLSVMILASILAVASLSQNNPAMAAAPPPDLTRGPKGIFRITRHPLMWAVALWAITHLMANGDAASILLFGGLAALAILGTLHSDRRRHRQLGAEWEAYARQTSHLPFLAIAQGRTQIAWNEIGWRTPALGFGLYLVLLVLHQPVIGVAPVSLVAGLFG